MKRTEKIKMVKKKVEVLKQYIDNYKKEWYVCCDWIY